VPDRKLLGVYLNDHLTAAAAGASLARRAAGGIQGPAAEGLQTIARELDEERREITEAMSRLGVRRQPGRELLGQVGERLGRFKLNGRLLERSPLSDVVELEGLALIVTGQLALWRALRAVAPSFPELDSGRLDRLVGRAEQRRTMLERLQAESARVSLA